jgi:hypothetical protein
MSTAENLQGQVFGYLLPEHRVSRPGGIKSGTFWQCKCLRCGRTTVVRANCLKNGMTKSCGCLYDCYMAHYKAGIRYDKSQHQGVSHHG